MPERLPKNACDTHLHVFGDPKIYPAANPNALYAPPGDCNFAAVKALHDAMGVDRAVFVQPTIYGTDHRALHDILKSAPKGYYRGVAIVDDSVSDAELARLDSVGVRGARFNFGGRFKLAPSVADFRRGLARVRELGWFVKVFGFEDDFLPVADELKKIDFPAIIDHMGGPDYRRGTTQPAVRLLLDLLKNGNWWIGLSNGDLRSQRRLSVGRCGRVRPPVLRSCAGPLSVGHRLAARAPLHAARQGRPVGLRRRPRNEARRALGALRARPRRARSCAG